MTRSALLRRSTRRSAGRGSLTSTTLVRASFGSPGPAAERGEGLVVLSPRREVVVQADADGPTVPRGRGERPDLLLVELVRDPADGVDPRGGIAGALHDLLDVAGQVAAGGLRPGGPGPEVDHGNEHVVPPVELGVGERSAPLVEPRRGDGAERVPSAGGLPDPLLQLPDAGGSAGHQV